METSVKDFLSVVSEANPEAEWILKKYSEAIFETNKKFNLTGYKNIGDIFAGLVFDSLKHLKNLKVPRGTKFVDIGTGSGVPGFVLCSVFPFLSGTLLDSNEKKVSFINSQAEILGVPNVKAVACRAEEFASSFENRETFDFCVTKAFGPLYFSAEFSAPLLKLGGFLFIYSRLETKDLSEALLSHFNALGYDVAEDFERKSFGVGEEGLMWVKKMETPSIFPRKFPVVKRQAEKIPEKRI